MKQKKFIDIQHASFEPTEFIDTNIQGFEVGDRVVVQEKVDGANASVSYDPEADALICWSHKRELSSSSDLRGFWGYVQSLPIQPFKDHPNWCVFGEWLVRHTVRYDESSMNRWYVFDIWDRNTQTYLLQDQVKDFCMKNGFDYVHTYYDGPFTDWEDLKGKFLGKSVYGEHAEGFVIKNQSKMNQDDNRLPAYLKVVDSFFKETQKSNHVKKELDPQKTQEKERAEEMVNMVVTEARVRKMILKLVDEGILPEIMKPKDMQIIAKNLPKRVYEDCLKEHPDIVKEGGEYFGKICGGKTMQYAKQIVLG